MNKFGALLSLLFFLTLQALSANEKSGWRVIPEDKKFPTDDVIVAFCEVTDAKYNLPKNTAKEDCTEAIQAALDDASKAGGGTVFIPEGFYKLEGTLKVESNVFLRGRWRQLTKNSPAAGTILIVENTKTESVITNGSGSGIRDLTFWNPQQKADSISEYPFVINGRSSPITIENVTLINLYNGINLSKAGACCIRGLYGTPLKTGLTADKSFAVSRYDNIHFSPDYWAWSKLPGSPQLNGQHRKYMRSNGTGVNIGEMDGFYFWNSTISGFKKGIHFQKGASGDDASGELSYVHVSDCDTALHVDDAKGFKVVGSTFAGSEYGIWGKDNTNYKLHTSRIEGGINSMIITRGAAKLVNCQVTGEVKAKGRRTFLKQYNYQQKLPNFKDDYQKERKPLKTDFFNVKDFGAKGDRKADDTAAIKAAISAANKNGGGIVFIPDGEYRVRENLTLQKGVEIRGNSGGRHMIGGRKGQQPGSMIFIEVGEGDEDGQAFLTMNDFCGLRGVSFYHPHQDYKSFKKYPFMIRAQGEKNYIIDCAAANPYRAAELSGDDHLVEYTFFGGIRQTYVARNCRGGRIQNCHIKPDFWRDTWLPESPKTAELLELKMRINSIYEPIYLKDCDDYTVASIFNHASHTMMTVDNSSGQSLMVSGEQLQHGYAFKNGSKTFDLLSSHSNINHIGNRKGTYGTKTFPSFKGKARFFCSSTMGTSDETWSIQGGQLFLQLCTIDGPSNRGANSIHCGEQGESILQASGSGTFYVGIENKGKLSFQDCRFSHGFLNSAAKSIAGNTEISKVFILADINQPEPKAYGLSLNTENVKMGDAIIIGGLFLKDSIDGRRLKAARLSGSKSFSLNVTDPDFQKGAKTDLSVDVYLWIDNDCTIKSFYKTKNGMTLGNSTDFKVTKAPYWKTISFKATDSHFDSNGDIRLEIEGKSPGLAKVVITSSQLSGTVEKK